MSNANQLNTPAISTNILQYTLFFKHIPRKNYVEYVKVRQNVGYEPQMGTDTYVKVR